MLKKKLLLALVALLPSYSYSDSITPYYGTTGNAAADQALRWSMDNVFPSPPGLEVQNVIYSYRIQKETGEWVTVHVYNETANGNGYVFRETDEWKPGSLAGTQINKVVGIGGVHRSAFGDGGIDVEGNGSVTNPSVVYTYRVDPCYDPQSNPSCPGYEPPVPDNIDIDLTNLYPDVADREQYSPDNELYKEEKQMSDKEKAEQEAEEEKDRKERLEKALAAADTSAMFAQALAQSQVLDSMNQSTNISSYYEQSIPGGTYRDSVQLVDKQLPDNRRGLRNNLAQQLLHQQMVDQQYENK